jgi:Mannosyltransferase (PIG-V)
MSSTTTTTMRPLPADDGVTDPAPGAGRSVHERRWDGARLPLAVYALSRLMVVSTAWVVTAVSERDLGRGPWPRLPSGPAVLHVLSRWDAAWYVSIADSGYPAAAELPRGLARVAFFPLLPLVVRVGRTTGLSPMMVGVVVATVTGAVGLLLVWRLVDDLSGRAAANRASALLALFPGSFALSMVYSEGLLLLGAAGCLAALHRRAWVWAGIAGLVATSARPTGVVVVLACAWAAVRAREWRAVAAPAIASIGVIAYGAFLWGHGGSAALWLRSEQEAWKDHVDFGRSAFERVRVIVIDRPPLSLSPSHLDDIIGAVGLTFVLVSLVLLWRWRPPAPVVIYAVGAIAMAVMSAHVGPRPRMIFAAFPLIAAVGVMVRGKPFAALLGGSTVLLVVLSAILFTTKALTP